jgi:putative chitinase
MSIATLLHLHTDQQRNLEHINAAWQQYGDGDARKYAYIVATAWHECNLRPVSEYGNDAYLRRYENRTDIGNRPGTTDYKRYKGHGFVQLTGRGNYIKAGRKLGIDLVNHPERALEPTIAAQVLVQGMLQGWFTKHKLSDYINSHRTNYTNARRVVNGDDKADRFAATAKKIYNAHPNTGIVNRVKNGNIGWVLLGIGLAIAGIGTFFYFKIKK